MNTKSVNAKKSEKGAAMVTVLMITLVLLVASAGVLLEASMHTANVTDAIAEEQAYVAAESGIQTAVYVLRGNRDPYIDANLLDSAKTSTSSENLINYIRALRTTTSNLGTDASTEARLSRWIQYDANYNDRVVVGDSATYAPRTGTAFKLSLSDPDKTGTKVVFDTYGRIEGSSNPYTFGTGTDVLTMTYTQKAPTTLDIPGDSLPSDIGTFNINISGTVTLTSNIRFEIIYKMTDPYDANRTIRGYLKLPEDSNGDPIATTVDASNLSTSGVKLFYSSPMYVVMGSNITMTGGSVIPDPIAYEVTPVIGDNVINCNIAPAEPQRILIKATGYGPRGAKKELEAIIQKNFFNGMSAPATLTMVGSTTDFTFDPGNSTVIEYSGQDLAEANVIIPPVGTTNDTNLAWVNTQFSTGQGWKANVIGDPANVSEELPLWLSSAAKLDALIVRSRKTAEASGNYYSGGNGPGTPGDYDTGTGITFIDGDYTFGGGDSGGGLLICTGKLTLHGKFSFKGMIIVTGPDGVLRTGGGNGTIRGNMVIAPYDPTSLSAGFTSPKYDISGGGTSTLTYDSDSVANGLMAVSNFVIGVAER